jgi:putative membrane protein
MSYKPLLAVSGLLWLTVSLSAADTAFLKDACQGGLMEMKLGELAQTNAASEEVKEFGRRMVADHGRMNQDVQELAGRQGVSLPTEISMKDKVSYEMLSHKTGPEFDRAYIEDMVKDHKADIAAFQKEVESGTDQHAQAVAAKALTTIRAHLKLAQEIAGRLGVPQ